MIIPFPKKIRSTNHNPIVDFYSKCLKLSNIDLDLDNIQITAFIVNPKDFNILKKKLFKFLKGRYSKLSFQQLKFEVDVTLIDFGPRVSSLVEQGTVVIDEVYIKFPCNYTKLSL